jgi:hypothetical protein
LWKFDRNNKRCMSVVSPSPRTTPEEISSYNTSGIDSHGAIMKISQSVWDTPCKKPHTIWTCNTLSLSLLHRLQCTPQAEKNMQMTEQ